MPTLQDNISAIYTFTEDEELQATTYTDLHLMWLRTQLALHEKRLTSIEIPMGEDKSNYFMEVSYEKGCIEILTILITTSVENTVRLIREVDEPRYEPRYN